MSRLVRIGLGAALVGVAVGLLRSRPVPRAVTRADLGAGRG